MKGFSQHPTLACLSNLTPNIEAYNFSTSNIQIQLYSALHFHFSKSTPETLMSMSTCNLAKWHQHSKPPFTCPFNEFLESNFNISEFACIQFLFQLFPFQMIWEQGSVVIVQLSKLTENGVAMCHRYWPEEGSDLYHIYEVKYIQITVVSHMLP